MLYAIHARTGTSAALIDDKLPTYPEGKPKSERNELLKEFNEKKANLKKEVIKKYDSLRSLTIDTTVPDSTCIKESISIIKEVKKCFNKFYRLQVFYLSDMKEDCKKNIEINIADSSKILADLKLVIILPTPQVGEPDDLKRDDVESIWKPFFIKYGAHPDSIYIERRIPDNLFNEFKTK